MRLKQGDEVEVIAGNDKGVRGTVQKVLRKENKVVVSGVNIVKKHQKPRQSSTGSPIQGGIIEFEAPLHVSNVMLVCPHTDELTRIGIRRDPRDDGTNKTHRVRFSKRSGKDID